MSHANPQPSHAEFRSLIAAIERRWLRLLAFRTIGRAAAAGALAVLVGVAIERLARPGGMLLVALVAATGLAAVACAAVVWRRLRHLTDDRRVARFVEERAALAEGAPLDDALVSAVDLVQRPPGAARSGFAELVISRAVTRLREINPARVIEPAALRRAALEAAAGAAMLALSAVIAAPAASRAAETARLHFFPGSVRIEVFPGNLRVPAGTPVRIRATVRDGAETMTGLTPLLTVAAGDERRVVPMVPAGQAFELALESVDRTFTYAVSAGGTRSSDYTVTALFAPRVRRIDVEYSYPAFTGLRPRVEQDGGDIYGPAGTRVRLRIHTDKPIARGELAPAGAAAMALRPSGERVLEADLVLARDDSYRIRLADTDGLRSSGDTEYFIRLMDDRPPEVRILRPSADQQITPLEEVAIEARADDDYGIAHFDLVYSVAGGRERVVPFDRVTGTDVEKVGARLIAAEDLRVSPGDVITYYARVRDVARGKRATEARSDIFFLEVKPFSEEFVVAQSQASSGGGNEIDGLVAAQKEIISATWNIERRSGAGRSTDDVAAIARAQAELKARVDRMAGGGGRSRGGGRPPGPERFAAAAPQEIGGASDPIAAAAAAMARALQQLEGQKTREALAHEMTALKGLLQAQADVRRRQVSQGSSGSGSGGNRSSQDLSALFDKELQRQQRTNYENRSPIENRPDRNESTDSALDRIRDLAKRQEDLSRRQGELADAGLSTEELKRQLEKLTREQIELRQQAEELARDLQRQRGQQGQQGRQGQPAQTPAGGRSGDQAGGGGRDVERAAEEMRSAASELRRENAEAAAESGKRATEQLRRLEDRMRGSSEATSQRATGELQVEAQQVAQEQRRVAAEASRLENTGGAGDEARRRLADEQERLARRVEDLQRSAQQLARSGKGAEAASAAEAAKELEKQRIAERMRDSARDLRGGGQPAGAPQGSTAAREQEIARALERAVDKLGGGSAETRRLSERLEQTRGIRERLNRLEQQVRDAEARSQQGSRGRAGQQGRGASAGGRAAGDDVKDLQRQYQQELERARDALAQLGQGEQRTGTGMSTPEEEEFSRSAPGTEAFKQDRSDWETLRKEIDRSLERYEASASERLRRTPGTDRLNAGGSERVPEGYRAWIARYYESLARVKK